MSDSMIQSGVPSAPGPAPASGFPAFFEQAPVLRVRDPLARFLGATPDGVIEYRYADAVRLAGHSCPTVAGAYLMVVRGLRALYGESLPERGGIDVLMRDDREDGTTGVVASVATLLTGAATETGFAGIGAGRRFNRRSLLAYDAPIDALMALRRRDTGAVVEIDLDANVVPWNDEMRMLIPKAVTERATDDELERFGQLWQERVRAMLIDHAEDEAMVRVMTPAKTH